METKAILHMTKGDGEFSYAQNANSHETVLSNIVEPLLESTIKSLLSCAANDVTRPCRVMNVADLGCGVGRTPIAVVTTIRAIVHKLCKELKWDDDKVPELQMYMSDLPSNDFNLLFSDVTKLQHGNTKPLCFVMGAPGSFHDRLFPSNTLHLVHSNYAIHWLSQVPPGLRNEVGAPVNKGKILPSETSPPEAVKAYYAQFQQDFTSFLKCRSDEVVPNGYMVLATTGRPSIKPWETRLFQFLSQALSSLVSKGVIKEEKLDTFDLPIYFPCKEEIEEIVTKEGSFAIEHLEVVFDDAQNEVKDTKIFAEFLAKIARSTSEVMVSYHFGPEVWNDLYKELNQVIFKDLEADNGGPFNIFNIGVYLRKKDKNM